MKPCPAYRKQIAWLAADTLDADTAACVRKHVQHCEPCRHYLEEMSLLTNRLVCVPDPNVAASESFHRRVAKRLQPVEAESIDTNPVTWLRRLMSWRIALPSALAAAIALVAMLVWQEHPHSSPTNSQANQTPLLTDFKIDLAPTLANYRAIASESVEVLDDLLTKQGSQPLPPMPGYAIAGSGSVNGLGEFP